jgi:hypothetical protein
MANKTHKTTIGGVGYGWTFQDESGADALTVDSAGLGGNAPLTLTGIAEPGAPTAAVLTTAGNLNGRYRYKVTFVTANGETGPGTPTPEVNPVNQQVSLTAIPVGPAAVTARRIYRLNNSVGTDQFYKLVTTLADNTTTSYTDNIADASLGARKAGVNTTAPVRSPSGLFSNVANPAAPVHVVVPGEAQGVTVNHLGNPHYVAVFESEDAMLGLFSAREGGHGSGIDLVEMDPAGTVKSKWGVIRYGEDWGFEVADKNALTFYYEGTGNADSSTGLKALRLRANGDLRSAGSFIGDLDEELRFGDTNNRLRFTTLTAEGAFLSGGGSVFALIDANNNTADAVFAVRKDSNLPSTATNVFQVREDGDAALGVGTAFDGFLHMRKDQAAETNVLVENYDTAGGAQFFTRAHDGTNPVAGLSMISYGSAATATLSGFVRARSAYLRTHVGAPVDRLVIGTSTAAPLHLVTADTAALTVDASQRVGIGTLTPNPAAILDLSSTTRGMLLPRMTTAQRDAIASPPDGLVVYNTTVPAVQARVGAAWVSL